MRRFLIPRKPAFIIAAVFLAMIAANLLRLVPVYTFSGVIPVFCPFHAITGIHCPGCGMTRAILSLVTGNLSDAFIYNPFCFFLIFIVLISLIPEKWLNSLGMQLARTLHSFYVLVLSLILAFWVFDRLIPHFIG